MSLLEDWQTTSIINAPAFKEPCYRLENNINDQLQCAGVVASEAKDGVAPASRQDGVLREEQHLHAAICTNDYRDYFAGEYWSLRGIAYFGAGVYPSMNPSWVQLRRCAIHGFACHTNPEALVDQRCCYRD
ncbi:hypothetical protein FXF61_09325 [Pseudomonas sp. C27(2019)]|uniref:hypothetical protein n=1 Tax=Pseudomonas sp. C27(2019) TaxID=2604941 RepID=UPI001246817A|nr:hypothetical protein [Pseudomonas sp. C27(2019)]QEY59345.1 hypothetical protein FXF61_09325 [Pseudomonas sp. C27(2019)]